MRCRLVLVVVLLPTLTAPASAQLFRKARKVDPRERVPELVTILQSDKDEHKRVKAVDELRKYHGSGQFPDIAPVLIGVLQNDKKPAVRAEAAQVLARLRPVSQPVGQALEQALEKDPSMRVRLQARSSLLRYHWAGYRADRRADNPPPLKATREPPLAPPEKAPLPPPIRTTGTVTPPSPPGRTTPTPPAPPRLTPTPVNSVPIPPVAGRNEDRQTGARPLPPGPTQEPPVAPPPAPEGEGPSLTGPGL
jgi:hypothetical protein